MWFYAWLIPCIIGYLFLSWIRRWICIDDVKRRRILITGCDAGFGNLLAQRLDMLGCHVFAACLTESARSRLKQVSSERLKAFVMDVTNTEHVRQAVEIVKQSLGEKNNLWAVVNNVGIIGHILGPTEWHHITDFQQVMEVNTMGTVRVTLAFLPLLKKSKGRIVNMSSGLGRVPVPVVVPYCMSKAAIEIFSDGIRQHLSQYGVTVHIIEPGTFQTDEMHAQRVRKAVQMGWKEAPFHIKQEFGEDYAAELKDLAVSLTNQASPNLHKVVTAYMHALTARCPRTRYTVGWDATLIFIPLSYLPSVVLDFFTQRIWGKLIPSILKQQLSEN